MIQDLQFNPDAKGSGFRPQRRRIQDPGTIVFFGTSRFAVIVLDELTKAGFVPALIVTTPDMPQGRRLVLTPSPVKLWAQEHDIPLLQPEKLDNGFSYHLSPITYNLFIVASYGKLIPREVLSLPTHGTLNVHPSLLPKYRGPSPIQSQILADEKTVGVSVMLLDEEMDHGPILTSKQHAVAGIQGVEWPLRENDLEEVLAHEGGKLLAEIIPGWIEGTIEARPQDHSKATYTKKIEKEDGLIDLTDDPYQNFLKIRAYDPWPGTYFFFEKKSKKIRVLIKDARFKNGELVIMRVLPEGKKEMDYDDFLRGMKA